MDDPEYVIPASLKRIEVCNQLNKNSLDMHSMLYIRFAWELVGI